MNLICALLLAASAAFAETPSGPNAGNNKEGTTGTTSGQAQPSAHGEGAGNKQPASSSNPAASSNPGAEDDLPPIESLGTKIDTKQVAAVTQHVTRLNLSQGFTTETLTNPHAAENLNTHELAVNQAAFQHEQQVRNAEYDKWYGKGARERITEFEDHCFGVQSCNHTAATELTSGADHFVDLRQDVDTGKVKDASPEYKTRHEQIKTDMKDTITVFKTGTGRSDGEPWRGEFQTAAKPVVRWIDPSAIHAPGTGPGSDKPPQQPGGPGSLPTANPVLPGIGDPGLGSLPGSGALPSQGRQAVDAAVRGATSLAGSSRGTSIDPAPAASRLVEDMLGASGGGGADILGTLPGSSSGGGASGAAPVFAGSPSQGAASSPSAPALAAQASEPARRADALTVEAKRNLSVGDPKSALAALDQAVALNPKSAQAYSLRAIAETRLKDYPAAVAAAQQGLVLAPHNAALLDSQALALNHMGRYKEALAAADEALAANPRDAVAYFNKAAALGGLHQRSEMLEALRAAAALNPRFQPVLEQAMTLPEGGDLMLLPAEDMEAKRAAPTQAAPSPGLGRNAWIAAGGAAAAVLLGLIVFAGKGRKAPVPPPAFGRGTPLLLAGKYELGRELGSGGMGVVFEGSDRLLKRKVAVKRMREEIRWDKRERERFLSEARVVAALRHANIVNIIEIVEQDNEVYLVFEYVPGKTLGETIEAKGTIPFGKAREMLRGAAAALDFAHGRGVIHRDLKPSNIMVEPDGRVRLMDFGVARVMEEAVTRHSSTRTRAVGTPVYMAPEHEQGTARPESDVYSLALCFYEAVSGRRPFLGSGAGLLMNKLNRVYDPLTKTASGVPEGADRVLARAFEPEPAKRYPDAGSFLRDLEALG